MITASNKNSFIEYSLSDKTSVNIGPQLTYTPELPTITCSNECDAVRIQDEINTFTNKLIKNLLK